ncbi:glycosyltransferase, partial [bacterium]|nr:glycosyltransferase [bacterium]
LLVDHGIQDSKICTVMNAVDDKLFCLSRGMTVGHEGREGFTLIYHGTLVKRYGVDVAIRAVNLAAKEIPRLRFLVYGDGDNREELETITGELGLQNTVVFSGKFLPLEQIPGVVAQADVGLVPNRDSALDNVLPTKLMEYVAMGIPAIVSRTDTVEAYFDDTMVRFVPPEDEEHLAEAILELYHHPEKAQSIAQNARRHNEQYGWARQRTAYYKLIDSLLNNPRQQAG